MKNKIYNILIFVFLGICFVFVLINPVTNLINRIYNDGVVTIYNSQVSSMKQNDKDYLFEEAHKYNENLNNDVADCFSPDAFNSNSNYAKILNITEDGVMGTISIPEINVNLPIYHGTDEKYYDKGAVHLASTSLPVGGENTHSVVSAHTAYPGKVFFDKLTDMESGDFFYITILDRTFAYKVCQVNVVLPNETELLKMVKGQDLVTLVTCTPYAVNTHRLLVRGQRDLEEEKRLVNENIKVNQSGKTDKMLYYLIIIFIIAILLSGVLIFIRNYKKKGVNAYVAN